ncbi:MAG: N-acetyltransferase, partial [Frankiales bacterium]
MLGPPVAAVLPGVRHDHGVPSLTIAEIRPDQLDQVGELTASVYAADGFTTPDYVPALRDVASRVRSATVLVAEQQGRLVGAVTVATRGGEWAEQSVPGEAVIRMLVVDPSARGGGTGQACTRAW